jgi:exosortase B
MSTELTAPVNQATRKTDWFVALAVGTGLLVLYGPTLIDLFRGYWVDEEQGHGPIIFAVSVWLIIRKWSALRRETATPGASILGFALFLFALLAYVVGRSQAIIQLEVGSSILVLGGLAAVFFGYRGLRVIGFPLFFMLFMIPLPGVFVQSLTIPLKTGVSYVAESILYASGYPIGRSGVTLTVGPYQLLVADACAGMHTLFTLEALGLLYMNLKGHARLWRNIALAILIFPISFCANVVRVIVLILVTYHLGDAAGQGFLHGFAGMVLFLTALVLILMVDGFLERFQTQA